MATIPNANTKHHQHLTSVIATPIREELSSLWRIAFPITAMNCTIYLRALVSVLMLGRLGSLELAGGALSIGFTNITGYSVLVGLASGLEPLCSQSFGSGNYDLLSLSLQRTILLLLLSSLPISMLWVHLPSLLLFLRQDASISSVASTYTLYSLPDLLTNAFLQPLRVYLRSQGLAKPMMWCTAAAVAMHVPLNMALVFGLGMGVPGVALAQVLTNLNMVVLVVGYLRATGACGTTWKGWSWKAATGLGPLLRLALPSCVGICLEWWWYEIVTVLSGYLPHPTVAVAATAILIQTTSLMYTLPMSLAASVSARVGNELGAGNPRRARLAALVALGCASAVAAVHVAWTSTLGRLWCRLFTDDVAVVSLAAAALPLLGLCELGNCPQTTGCGVLRGTARPSVGARINLLSFYLVGTPVAVGLAFWWRAGFLGLWFGLLTAQACCAASVLVVVLCKTDWDLEALRAKKLTNVEMAANGNHNGNVNNGCVNGGGEVAAVVDDEEKGLLLDGP